MQAIGWKNEVKQVGIVVDHLINLMKFSIFTFLPGISSEFMNPLENF